MRAARSRTAVGLLAGYGMLSAAPFLHDPLDPSELRLATSALFAAVLALAVVAAAALAAAFPPARVRLVRLSRSASPWTAGALGASAGAAAVLAYNACADGRLSALPQVAGCHCWTVALGGLVAGAMLAALAALVRRLLQPLLAGLWPALGASLRPGCDAPVLVPLRFARSRPAPEPLATLCAGRAPPLRT